MLHIDADRPPTPLQRRLLTVIRACGPCPLAAAIPHFTANAEAVRLASHVLRRGGWIARLPDGSLDVTAAGRQFLAACHGVDGSRTNTAPGDRTSPGAAVLQSGEGLR